jgi:hypothetical protein
MNSWHDLRIWMSGFLGALALAAFVAATTGKDWTGLAVHGRFV